LGPPEGCERNALNEPLAGVQSVGIDAPLSLIIGGQVHRRDIDGLRAVAIIPVVLFHFGVHGLSGGFVGVDVFFVISGYLITGIIFREIDDGNYSIADFYNRRIRRIFPALITVLVACLIVSFCFDLPTSIKGTSRAAVAALLFYSNFYFNGVSDYFDDAIKLNPLLHTWSLAVEEQFYVVFPLLAFAIRTFDRNKKFGILASIAVVSLAWSTWLVQVDRSAGFYLPQSRAWELLLGSILTLGVIPQVHRWKAEVSAIAGLLMILGSVFFLSEYSIFPGIGALAPAIGTAAIIHSGIGASTIVARILSTRPMVGVGVISYSMYLWHWPMVTFYRAFYGEPSRSTKMGLVIAVIAISTLSLNYIEKPFRSKPHLLTRLQTLAAGGFAVAALALAAMIFVPVALNMRQISADVVAVDDYSNYDSAPDYRAGRCFLSSRFNNFNSFDIEKCLHINPAASNVLLIGDSHAAHLWIGLAARYPEINFLQATSSGCKPVTMPSGANRCTDLMNMVFNDFLPNHHVDSVILSGDWDEADLPAIERTIEFVKKLSDRTFVIGPSPSYMMPLPMILARRMLEGNLTFPTKLLRPEQIHIDEEFEIRIDKDFESRMVHGAVTYVSLYKALCAKQCLLWSGRNEPLQFDSNHFTARGSMKVAEIIGPQMFPSSAAGIDPSVRGITP
jgi:peptidoglycan/LPS O-acetylase OafA/YrhL